MTQGSQPTTGLESVHTQLERLRRAASKLMLGARACGGIVTVDEWDAIALLHLLPGIEQVPGLSDDGWHIWTTREAEHG